MPDLPTIDLPLTPGGPPSGYGWSERPLSDISTVTAFRSGIDNRDRFAGRPRCVVCGVGEIEVLQHCHIIPVAEPSKVCMTQHLNLALANDALQWVELKDHGWIPQHAKHSGEHEPRNGLLMCPTHQLLFDRYYFFIRYMPRVSLNHVSVWVANDSLRGP